jgi:hypothetical protein
MKKEGFVSSINEKGRIRNRRRLRITVVRYKRDQVSDQQEVPIVAAGYARLTATS